MCEYGAIGPGLQRAKGVVGLASRWSGRGLLGTLVCAALLLSCVAGTAGAAGAPTCGETLSSGAVSASYSGTACVTGPVWVAQQLEFGSIVIEQGGSLYLGYPPIEGSAAAGCATSWNGSMMVKGQLTVDVGGSLQLNSSTSCNGGGTSLVSTGGGLLNEGTVVAAASGSVGTTKWAAGGSRTIQGSVVNKGTITVDTALVLVGRGTFENEGKISVGVYAAPQGEQSQIVTVAPPGKGQGPLAFVNGPGGTIALTQWHSGTQYVFGSFTVQGPNTFSEQGGKTVGAPIFDQSAKLSYKGHGASTIGITGSTAISGTIPSGSVLALSDPRGGGSETCGAAAFVDTAPAGLTIAKGATLMGYGSAPCNGPSSTTLKLGSHKSLVNDGTVIGGSCGNAATLRPGTYGKPDVFCIGGPDIFQGRVLNNGRFTVEPGVTLSFTQLANYQAKTHKLKGGSYGGGGTIQVNGVTVPMKH